MLAGSNQVLTLLRFVDFWYRELKKYMALILAFHKKESYQKWLNCVFSHVLYSLSLLAVVIFHLFVESSLTTANYVIVKESQGSLALVSVM